MCRTIQSVLKKLAYPTGDGVALKMQRAMPTVGSIPTASITKLFF